MKLSNRSEAQRRAVLNNRSRTGRSKSKRLQRRRSEVVERTFAHVCETGGARRSYLRGLVNMTKRYLIALAAHNLGRIMRRLLGVGKPKALQGVVGGLFGLTWCLITMLYVVWNEIGRSVRENHPDEAKSEKGDLGWVAS
jgi:transposase